MLLDALKGETFVIEMATSIQQLTVKNLTPGQLYVFIFRQNQKGNHSLQWGAGIRNASAINLYPFSTTIQCLTALSDGTLLANIPGTWN